VNGGYHLLAAPFYFYLSCCQNWNQERDVQDLHISEHHSDAERTFLLELLHDKSAMKLYEQVFVYL